MERSTVQSCLAAPVYWGFKALTIFPGCGARQVEVKQRHRRCRLCVEGRKIRLALLRVSDLKVGTIQRVREHYEIGSNALWATLAMLNASVDTPPALPKVQHARR